MREAIRRFYLAGLLLLFSAAPTLADIIEVKFSGTVFLGYYSLIGGELVRIDGVAYTSDYLFDTTLSTLQTLSDGSHELSGDGAEASVTFAGLGTIPVFGGGYGILIWQDGFSSVLADVRSNTYVANTSYPEGTLFGGEIYGGFQLSTCPSNLPCGEFGAP